MTSPDRNRERMLFSQGRKFINHGRYQEAVKVFDQALVINPNNSSALASKGYALRRQWENGKDVFDHARDAIDKAMALDPNNSEANSSMAYVKIRNNNWSEAMRYSQKAIDLDSNNTEAYINKGVALANTARIIKNMGSEQREALSLFDRAIQIDPENSRAYGRKGWLLRLLGNTKEAIAYCDKAISINPNEQEFYVDKMWSLQDIEDYNGVIKVADQCLNISDTTDNSRYAYRCKIASLYKLKRYKEELAVIDKVEIGESVGPIHRDLLKSKAYALDGLGRYEEALSVFSQLEKERGLLMVEDLDRVKTIKEKIRQHPTLTEERVREIAREIADQAILEHPIIRQLQKEGVKKDELEKLIESVIQTRQQKSRWRRQQRPPRDIQQRIEHRADTIIAQNPNIRKPLKQFLTERVMNATDPERVFNAFLPIIAAFGPVPHAAEAVAVVQALNILFSKRVMIEDYEYRS